MTQERNKTGGGVDSDGRDDESSDASTDYDQYDIPRQKKNNYQTQSLV